MATPTPTVFDNDAPAISYQLCYVGVPVEVHDIPPEQQFDWSACRSPARAQRRYRQGHPQRVKISPQRVKISYRERAFFVRQASSD